MFCSHIVHTYRYLHIYMLILAVCGQIPLWLLFKKYIQALLFLLSLSSPIAKAMRYHFQKHL